MGGKGWARRSPRSPPVSSSCRPNKIVEERSDGNAIIGRACHLLIDTHTHCPKQSAANDYSTQQYISQSCYFLYLLALTMQPPRSTSTQNRRGSGNGGDVATVFRVPNGGAASARSSEVNQEQRGGAIAPIFFSPSDTFVDSVSPSFTSTTNTELSIKTFSEDSDDSRSSIDHLLGRHRRHHPIFRPISGVKRQYNVCEESDDEIVCRSPIRQRLSPSPRPQLCLANAIGSDEEENEWTFNESCYDQEQTTSAYTSIASPIPLPSNVTPSASPFSVFFAEARTQIHAESNAELSSGLGALLDHPLTLGEMNNPATCSSINNSSVEEKEETRGG